MEIATYEQAVEALENLNGILTSPKAKIRRPAGVRLEAGELAREHGFQDIGEIVDYIVESRVAYTTTWEDITTNRRYADRLHSKGSKSHFGIIITNLLRNQEISQTVRFNEMKAKLQGLYPC